MLADIVKVNREAPERLPLEYAADMIRGGRVVGIPTDTFYGLAADAFNLYAVEEVFQIKGRASHKPILLLVNSVEQAEQLSSGDLPPAFYSLTGRFWPGPLTIVIEASRRVPLKITGNTGKVAVRFPNARVAAELISLLNAPITGTSANLAGQKECSTAGEVRFALGNRVPLILDAGPSGVAMPSTIVEVNQVGWRLVREGAIPTSQIEDILAA